MNEDFLKTHQELIDKMIYSANRLNEPLISELRQEVFCKILAGKYDPKRASASTYIRMIIDNVYSDLVLRKEGLWNEKHMLLPDFEHSLIKEAAEEPLDDAVDRIVASLPKHHQTLCRLILEGQSVRDLVRAKAGNQDEILYCRKLVKKALLKSIKGE